MSEEPKEIPVVFSDISIGEFADYLTYDPDGIGGEGPMFRIGGKEIPLPTGIEREELEKKLFGSAVTEILKEK